MFEANVERDYRAVEKLHMLGWRVLFIWECSTLDAETSLPDTLQRWIKEKTMFGELSTAHTKQPQHFWSVDRYLEPV